MRPGGSSAIAEQYADSLLAWLQQGTGIEQVSMAGSFRRTRETVGDVDILVVARNGVAVIAHLLAYAEISEVGAHGGTRATVCLKSGLQVDLRVMVGAVHDHFALARPRHMRRMLRALDSPHLHVLAHPSGRLIGEREPMDLST